MDRPSLQRSIAALCALVALPLVAFAQNAPGKQTQTGEWALHGSSPRIISRLTVTTATGRPTTLSITQFAHRNPSAQITSYRLDENNFFHLVIIRDDFREFLHLHPRGSAGSFKTSVALASGHLYYAYADSDPAGLAPQVFRFSIREGSVPPVQSTGVSASAPTALVGPYAVRISTTRLIAHTRAKLYLHFSKNGAPATDITPFLGTPAHAVAINTSDLSYLHIDPTLVSKTSPSQMHLTLPPIGAHAAYKLWVQFTGGGTVYTAPFTLVAK